MVDATELRSAVFLLSCPAPIRLVHSARLLLVFLLGLAWDSSAASGAENKDPVRFPDPFSLNHDVGEE